MASTEQRTGFRFGWGSKGDSEKSASQTNGSDSTDSTGTAAPTADETTSSTAADSAPSGVSQAGADADSSNGQRADDGVAHGGSETPAARQAPAVAPAPSEAWPMSDMPEPGQAATGHEEPRSTGFLADLMRAMQAAADQNRKQVTDRFRGDGRALIDSVRSRAGEDLNELRRAADADVAAIREWSKAEIARIKAETDERIASRKADLDQQVNDHGALIDREVEKVDARIATFEQQMEAFFARLQNVNDPTTFAAVAQEMPEPPSIEMLGAQARAEALAEVSLGTTTLTTDPATHATPGSEGARWDAPSAPAASESAPEPALPAVSQWAVPAETAQDASESQLGGAGEWASGTDTSQQSPTSEFPASTDQTSREQFSPNGTTSLPMDAPAAEPASWATEPTSWAGQATSRPGDTGSWPGESAAAPEWQAPPAGEDASMAQPATGTSGWGGSTQSVADGMPRPGVEPGGSEPHGESALVYGAPAPLVAEALSSASTGSFEPAPGDRTAGSWPASYEADPRLAALGIDGPQGASLTNTPSEEQPSAASDPWAAPAVGESSSPSSDPFAMPGEAFGSDAGTSESPAARLAGLVPSSELPANGRTSDAAPQPVPTQVVVTGLMSVASIASFKRHLSRIPGVQGVGVSSGPDGEFIFKTTHEPGVALADVIPTLPGFGAEVVNAAEGTINVAAHDPEADA